MNFRVLASVVIAGALASAAAARPGANRTVTLCQGTFAGTPDGDVLRFLGMPYAAAPTGARRWYPPVDAPRHRGILAADQFGPSCPQQLSDAPMMAWTMEYLPPPALGTNENCLIVNVWTPVTEAKARTGARLPVLFFIHGGGFTSGSSSVPIYDGANLARRGMVVVTINYRLGELGFLAHRELTAEQSGGSGNYGLQDQIAALRWVKSNVAAFGGDPSKVTLAGQSAGAWSVMALLASPQAKGLFRAAIALSTPDLGDYRPLAEGEERGTSLFAKWNVRTLQQARALPAAHLDGAAPYGNIVTDGAVIPHGTTSRAIASDVPLMMGYTLNDLFAPSPKVDPAGWSADARRRYGADADTFLRFYPGATVTEARHSAAREAGDRFEFGPLPRWVEERSARSPVYVYRFSHVEPGPDSSRYGAFHTSELPYMFDTLDKAPERGFTAVDRHVVRQFGGAIENFIKQADPNGAGLPRWAPLTRDGKELVEFGDQAVPSRIYPPGADTIIGRGKPPARDGAGERPPTPAPQS
ncbi:carboxylesterase family protein [Sphingomonas sp. BK235]|uniref:carboxylesterase/lipase family protein n=1 Tax=Sphingomonas sp. BK235 TaxID=2512131 RepID=UPI0010D04592|nr:carboxylesterase family protein [Sphingomonas sp. BK235]TCP32430.1 para-nitrobenzyl esterase [Sphingomonas sp. BK235]